MPSERDKAKAKRWWRPRFSVGTLVIVVTLVCAYLACWEPTRRWGIPAVIANADRDLANDPDMPPYDRGHATLFREIGVLDPRSPMPLVVSIGDIQATRAQQGTLISAEGRRYYLWLPGLTLRVR